MNGIIVVNKPCGITSRDVVNILCKKFNTKKIGHTGTLDPIAEGVLVICINKATKLVDYLTCNDKEYIATVKLGILTDTLDITGNILEERKYIIEKDKLEEVLYSFIGSYNQEVPIYSAVKINGKKLYEYARGNEEVCLPKRNVEIKNIKLISCDNDSYSFSVKVSKGTYIRSLIKDINDKLDIIGVMSNLTRTKQGDFDINNSYTLEDIENDNYRLIDIKTCLKDEFCVILDENLYKQVKNGSIINNVYNKDLVVFIYNDEVIAIYKKYNKDNTKIKPYKMFI